jgi:hypothetical protein
MIPLGSYKGISPLQAPRSEACDDISDVMKSAVEAVELKVTVAGKNWLSVVVIMGLQSLFLCTCCAWNHGKQIIIPIQPVQRLTPALSRLGDIENDVGIHTHNFCML